MTILAIDIGSSSVKAQRFKNGEALGALPRVAYPTVHDGLKVEVDADVLLAAVAESIARTESAKGSVDFVALSVMSPAWVAMDAGGKALTPIISHQDRRSIDIAIQLEERVGKIKHLELAGNRPFPGGISSTTCAWFLANQPDVMARADLVGHLNTFVHRRLTGARVIDPSNASFTGLYLTCQRGSARNWSDDLCAAVGISKSVLPNVLDANVVAGKVTTEAAGRFNLLAGTPILTGMVDTSAAMMVTGAADGQLFHSVGSTDVLGVACDAPAPHERLLTRCVGVGEKWMSVSTIAASGSALDWTHKLLFSDLSAEKFHELTADLAKRRVKSIVHFDPYLAGERTSVEQKQAAFTGLTLATTREEMLASMIEALAVASGQRLDLLGQGKRTFLPHVFVTGGAGALADLMHRDWPSPAQGQWEFQFINEAALAGLATLTPER